MICSIRLDFLFIYIHVLSLQNDYICKDGKGSTIKKCIDGYSSVTIYTICLVILLNVCETWTVIQQITDEGPFVNNFIIKLLHYIYYFG